MLGKPVQLAAHKIEGDPNLPPIIFIHGNGSTKDTWQVILENDYRPPNTLYALDLRGHGESYYEGDDFSLDAMSKDILHFLNNEEIARCVIVAHSMGARISIHFCAQNPDFIEGLMMIDMEMLPRPLKEASQDELDTMIKIGREHPNLESIKNALSSSGCYSKRKVAQILSNSSKVQRRQDGSCYLGTSPYVDYLTHNQIQASSDGIRSFADAASQDYPVSLVYADYDSSVTLEGLEEMQNTMSRLTCTQIPNTYHSVHKAQPDLFLGELASFLTRIRANIVQRKASCELLEECASSSSVRNSPPAPPPPLSTNLKASRKKAAKDKAKKLFVTKEKEDETVAVRKNQLSSR